MIFRELAINHYRSMRRSRSFQRAGLGFRSWAMASGLKCRGAMVQVQSIFRLSIGFGL